MPTPLRLRQKKLASFGLFKLNLDKKQFLRKLKPFLNNSCNQNIRQIKIVIFKILRNKK
jgi:hypothetical protein